MISLAAVEIERGIALVDPGELADLARRFGSSELIIAAQLAMVKGDGDLARTLVLEGAPAALVERAFATARVCVETGVPELAEELLPRGVLHSPVEEGQRLGALAVLAEARGEHAAASEDYAAAAEAFGVLELAPVQAHALQGLGRCLLALGDIDKGVTRLREARALWEQMKAARRIAEIDQLLASVSASDVGSG
jgi:tetratricopeptide (TPR) repeat protein